MPLDKGGIGLTIYLRNEGGVLETYATSDSQMLTKHLQATWTTSKRLV